MNPLGTIKEEGDLQGYAVCGKEEAQDVSFQSEILAHPENVLVINVDEKKSKGLEQISRRAESSSEKIATESNDESVTDCPSTEIKLKDCFISLQRCTLSQNQSESSEEVTSNDFKCDKCENSFSRIDDFHSHLQTHQELRDLECNICRKSFANLRFLKRHCKRMHLECNLYECNDCGEKFKQERDYKVHLTIHTGAKILNCPDCNKAFSRQYDLNRHMRVVHKKKLNMKIIRRLENLENGEIEDVYVKQEPFDWSENLGDGSEDEEEGDVKPSGLVLESALEKVTLEGNNDRLENPTIEIKPEKESDTSIDAIGTSQLTLKCSECPEEFFEERILFSHIKIHHTNLRPYKCGECQKSFREKSALTKHLKIHSGIRPFKCEACQRSFLRKNDVLKHMKTHEGLKPFQCEECQKFFTRKDSLALHMKLHSGLKQFKCDHCEGLFSQRRNLIRHMKVHTRKKTVKCKECRKVFTSKEAWMSHMKFHTKEKPFKCDECPRSFWRECELVSHLRIHPNSKPLKCDECQKLFFAIEHLRKHVKRMHSETLKCNECGEEFKRKRDYEVHLKFHAGVKIIHCPECSKAFAQEDYLRKHIRVMHKKEKVDGNMEVQDVYIKTEPLDCSESLEGCDLEEDATDVPSDLLLESSFGNVTHKEDDGDSSLNPTIEIKLENDYDTSDNIPETFLSKENSFKCNMCQQSFPLEETLTLHMKTHFTDNESTSHMEVEQTTRPFQCEICQKTFALRRVLKEHMQIHTGIKRFKCDQCQKSFLRKGALTYHIRTHLIIRPFQCDQCPKSFVKRYKLEVHKLTHNTDRPYQCEECEKTFTRRDTLMIHVETHSKGKAFKCELCEKSFFLKRNLRRHMRVHRIDKPFKCDQCERSFAVKSSLTAHLQIHLDVKPFKCKMCEKTFVRSHDLTSHMFKHSGIKPFKCGECEKSFFRKENYVSHMKIHSGVKPFKCEQCEKSFFRRPDLLDHLQTHLGYKPFQCEECQKSFPTNKGLKKHVRTVHSLVNALKCEECGETFKIKREFRLHLEFHAGAKILHCPECNMPFIIEKSLKSHVRKIHGKGKIVENEVQQVNIKTEPLDFSEEVEDSNAEEKEEKEKAEEDSKPTGLILESCFEKVTLQGNDDDSSRSTIEIKPENDLDLTDEVIDPTCNDNELFKCNECQKSFSRKHNLMVHMTIHTGEKSFKCDKCEKSFSRRVYLRLHLQTHSGLKPFECETCPKSFSTLKLLRRHEKTVHSDVIRYKYECQECGEKVKQKRDLEVHLKFHAGEKLFYCPECNKGFISQRYLSKHRRVVHRNKKTALESEEVVDVFIKTEPVEYSENPDDSYQEVQMGESIPNASDKTQYTVGSKKLHECEECQKSFSEKRNLISHMAVHTGERPFQCDQCERSFSRRSYLVSHLKTHLGLKEAKCGECHKLFSTVKLLKRHSKAIHSIVYAFKCDECGEEFTQKRDYAVHLKFHAGAQLMHCHICNMAFTVQKYLNRHIRVIHSRKNC